MNVNHSVIGGHTWKIVLAGLVAASCSADIHGNTINIPNAKVDFNVDATVDVNNVAPGQSIPVTMTVENVTLVEPGTTPPAEHVDDAGHIRVYMDDTASEPILITAQVNFTVVLPAATTPGNHRMICRVHRHDGKPTDIRKEINIVVKVSSDGGVSVDANTSSGTGGSTGTGGAGGATGTGGAGGGTI